MITLKNWNAKRAGAGITISGVNTTSGQIIKVVGIKEIYVGHVPGAGSSAIARTDDAEYHLSTVL